eukprot:14206361-Alexandrium_andersonii.AAC.1
MCIRDRGCATPTRSRRPAPSAKAAKACPTSRRPAPRRGRPTTCFRAAARASPRARSWPAAAGTP